MSDDTPESFDDLLRALARSPDFALLNQGLLGERFRLLRRLGQGGFGVVYEAEDLQDGARVALKLLRYAEADWIYRFKREFRALQGITHDGLVQLGELFCEDDRWFFSMELVDGADFVAHVRGTTRGMEHAETESGSRAARFDPARGAEHSAGGPGFNSARELRLRSALGRLFDALAVLHEAGKVHRDVKPSNVLVEPGGRVVLIDFGLVTDSRYTTESGLIGTPAYMSPEQATSPNVASASDLYSVGVMLYEALTGRLPLEGPHLRLLLDKQTKPIPAPSSLVPGIPADLDALCCSLLRVPPGERPTALDAGRQIRRSGVPLSPSSTDSRRIQFVGRARELERLNAAFARSRRGGLSVVLVNGESGIGKTRLVQHFTEQLLFKHPDTMLLAGQCHERETIPYKALDGIVDALSRKLARLSSDSISTLLPTRRTTLTRLFPVLSKLPGLDREPPVPHAALAETELRQRAFSELRELFTRVALFRATLIVIDDLQWADEDGLRALAEMLRPPDPPPLLFVGTWRGDAASYSPITRHWIEGFSTDLERIELAGLAADESRELAALHLAQSATPQLDAQTIAIESAGHPLFAEELARHAVTAGARTGGARLEDVLGQRLRGLDPAVRRLGELTAVATRPLPRAIAMRASGLSVIEFQRSLELLRTSNLLRLGSGRSAQALEMYHERTRTTFLSLLDMSGRQALHRCLASAFEAAPERNPEALALHWREAGELSCAGGYAQAAGELAFRSLAFDRAASWFEKALDWLPASSPERHSLHIRLGETLGFAGRGAQAAPHFEAAARESQGLAALELQRRAAEQLFFSGRFDQGQAASQVLLASMRMKIPGTRFATLVWLAYYRLRLALRGYHFRQREAEQIAAADLMRMDTCWSMASALALVETFAALVFLERALLLALDAGHIDRILRALSLHASLSGTGGGATWKRTRRSLRHARQLARRSGTRQAGMYALAADGIASYCRGRFAAAADKLGRAVDLLEDGSTGLIHEQSSLRIFLIQSLAFLGRFRELCRLQQLWLAEARARGNMYAAVNLRIGFGNCAWLVVDRPDLAQMELDAALRDWSTRGYHIEHYYASIARVWIALYTGDADSAYRLADELEQQASQSLLWRIQNLRLRTWFVHGTSALVRWQRQPGDLRQLRREIERCVRCIEREKMAWMLPFRDVLMTGLALAAGASEESTRARLEAVSQRFQRKNMAAYAAAAAFHAARLREGGAITARSAATLEPLRRETVVAPERLCALLLPGFGG